MMMMVASSFFYKEIAIYSIAVSFIPPAVDLNWVMNFHFYDPSCEHSVHLCSFALCQDTGYRDRIIMVLLNLFSIVHC